MGARDRPPHAQSRGRTGIWAIMAGPVRRPRTSGRARGHAADPRARESQPSIEQVLVGRRDSAAISAEVYERSLYLARKWVEAAVRSAGIAGFAFWRSNRSRKTCPNCGAPRLDRTSEVIQMPTKRETGLAMHHLTCAACGFHDHKSYPIGWSSREARQGRASFGSGGGRSSGGSSGFGGGRSSGGGASGKW